MNRGETEQTETPEVFEQRLINYQTNHAALTRVRDELKRTADLPETRKTFLIDELVRHSKYVGGVESRLGFNTSGIEFGALIIEGENDPKYYDGIDEADDLREYRVDLPPVFSSDGEKLRSGTVKKVVDDLGRQGRR